jgi:hypothetical protein
MTKVCRKCKLEKPLEEFTKHKKSKDGYDTICLLCNRDHASKWNKENHEQYLLKCKRAYRRNKTETLKKQREEYAKAVEYIESLKSGKCCIVCKYDKVYQVLHFHHRDEKTKKFGISASIHILRIAYRHPELIEEEIKKCDLLCPNCHAEEHFRRRQEKKAQKEQPLV